jgi:ABC-2 type transport system ATP-binding protein
MTRASEQPIISIEALCKSYRGASRPALDGVDLTIAQGDFFALLGPNGAGKTTLISILCGLFVATSGRIRLRAAAGDWLEPRASRSFLGLVPQELAFYPTLTVLENLRYFGAMQGLAGAALQRGVDAALAVGRLQAVTDSRAETLSGGLKRRLSLAIGVVHAPRLLVLDEPTAGVDAQSRRFLGDELKRLNADGMTIIYTSHYLDEVQQLCNTVAVIDHGKVIAQGDLHELLQRDVVTLGFATRPSAALLAALGEIPGVTAVRHDGDRIALVTVSPANTLSAALAVAERQDIAVSEATMGHRDLEALFFQLTGKALRDTGADPLAA